MTSLQVTMTEQDIMIIMYVFIKRDLALKFGFLFTQIETSTISSKFHH
jgi:hypothetical protein